MATIPNKINDVTMELAAAVNKDITAEMLAAMEYAITKNVVSGQTLDKLWVSSARDQHSCPSRHFTGNGVDISRVNGKYISSDYETDATTKALVDGLQNRFESAPKRRENFGPTIQKKGGRDHPVTGHDDHFHWSVNGDHSACNTLFQRILRFFLPSRRKLDEVCDK